MSGINSKASQLDKTVADLQRWAQGMWWLSALVLAGVLLWTVLTRSAMLPGAALAFMLTVSSSVLYWAAYDLSRKLRQDSRLTVRARALAMMALYPLVGATIMLVATWSLG